MKALLLPILSAIALPGADRIGEVDFKNFECPWDAERIAVPADWKWLAGKPTSTLRVAQGRFVEAGPRSMGDK